MDTPSSWDFAWIEIEETVVVVFKVDFGKAYDQIERPFWNKFF
jgi:hypothetical protein